MRTAIREEIFEILSASGTPVGSIMGMGLSSGPPPPGAPAAQSGVNFAVIGGTGAFAGVRGISGSTGGNARQASITEDPVDRRINGGGKSQRILTLYPMSAPQIAAIAHPGDFSAVNSSRPAAPGEILSIFAGGLGPTNPGVDPGQPFSATRVQTVNSPVQVSVNGRSAETLAAVGFPGAVDGYQVNFRLPSDTAKGIATIQVSAAWISSAPVKIPVQ